MGIDDRDRFRDTLAPSAFVLSQVVSHGVLNGIVTDSHVAGPLAAKIFDPFVCGLLRLREGKDLHTIRVYYVICRSQRLISAAVLGSVLLGDPRSALCALPVANRHSLGNGAPIGFAPLLQ